jgi:hypothetical protein
MDPVIDPVLIRPKGKAGWLAILLFSLPFSAVGVFTVIAAVGKLRAGNVREAGFLTLFALVFGGVGTLLLTLAIHGRKAGAKEDDLRAQNPEAPWLWRPDWAMGLVKSSTKSGMIFAWVFAIFWNLISAPILFLVPAEVAKKHNSPALIALLFPLIGLGLLAWAIHLTLRLRKFGDSIFEMASVPGAIGGALEGLIRPARPFFHAEGCQVRLSCIRRRTTGSGKNRNTTESVLWDDTETSQPDMNGNLPVSFAIPADAAETDSSDPSNLLLWRLEALAKVPGVDYAAQFEVPVFRVALTPEATQRAEEVRARERAEMADYQQPPSSRIRVRPSGLGAEFYFSTARNPGAALGLTVFGTIWFAVIWAIFHFGAPLLFRIVFSVAGAFILYGMLRMWFAVTRVVIAPGQATVTDGLFGWGSSRVIPAGEIAEIKVATGMTAGTTVYHDLKIVGTNGRKTGAGNSIRDRREAEWLASEMMRLLAPRR